MSTAKKPRIPSLRHFKARDLGYVELSGKRIYLGPYGDPATQERYESTIAEWLANGRRLPVDDEASVTVDEVCIAYWRHAKEYYRRPDGTVTQSLDSIKQSIKPVGIMYGSLPAVEFGPKALRAVRESWVRADLSRRTVNDYTAQLKRMFKWAASHELVPPHVYHGLITVDGLRRGRSTARESQPIRPVPEHDIAAVRQHLPAVVNALIDVQLLTGARPGEIVGLRPIDFDTSADVWTVCLEHHKTSHRGRERVLYFGPQTKQIVKKYMSNRPIDKPLFSPQEAEQERHARAEIHRRPDQKPSPRKTDRQLGDQYTVNSYRKAVERACAKANVPKWTPNRLRHNAATRIRHVYGLEAAQIILGHASADVTQIYAERDTQSALRVIKEIG